MFCTLQTIPWLKSVTKLPVVIKGIQCVEDAVLAAEAGVDGILISNHGGMSLPESLGSSLLILVLQAASLTSSFIISLDSFHITERRPGIFSSLPSIDVLYRLRKERPDVFDKLEGITGVNRLYEQSAHLISR